MVLSFISHPVTFAATAKRSRPQSRPQSRLAHIQDLWDRNSTVWSEMVASGQDKFRRRFHDPAFFKLLGPVEGLTVLDAGCGEGYICRSLARKGAHVTGVDLSGALLEIAQKQSVPGKYPPQYLQGSITTLKGIKDNSQDRVISTMTLMDTPQLDKVMASFFRVLKPGGECVITLKHPISTWPVVEMQTQQDGSTLVKLPNLPYGNGKAFQKTVSFAPKPGETVKPTIESIHIPRKVADYINSLINAGFEVTKVAEPLPSEALCKEVPWLKPYQSIPFALMLKATKPIIRKPSLRFGALTEWQKDNVIYGLSADPPHKGHRNLITAAKKHLGVRHVRVFPSAGSPLKDSQTPFSDRLEMTRRLFSRIKGVEVLDLCGRLPAPTRSFDLLEALFQPFQTWAKTHDRIPFLCGNDIFEQFARWKNPKALIENLVFVVADRDPKIYPTSVTLQTEAGLETLPLVIEPLRHNPMHVSSTEIKKSLAEGHMPTEAVPREVLRWIRKRSLYQPST